MMAIDTTQLERYERRVDRLLAEYKMATAMVTAERSSLRDAVTHHEAAIEACDVAQRIAAEVQQQAHAAIAAIVSRCLTAVFDHPYEFKIEFERKRGRTEARLVFVRDGMEISPLGGAGGGVVDVAAFALRLACVLLHRPQLRPVLVLDEPFRFVSADVIPRVRALLDQLAADLGVQLIIVTHIAGLMDDDTIRLGMNLEFLEF